MANLQSSISIKNKGIKTGALRGVKDPTVNAF